MRQAPRKLSSDEALYTAALRALMRRAHSTFEMRLYLERRAEEPAAAKRILARLKQEKMIDDERYALEFARARAKVRRQGGHRIARELRKRGVPDRHIESAVAQVFTETDEAALVRKVIERRLRAARAPLDDKKLASLYRTLFRAGFDASLIRREVRAAARDAAASDAAADDPPDLPIDDSGDQGRLTGPPHVAS